VHFARLRLAGFKSFVDPTELVIAPGLTGIVGPNGCGKSNLLEGLRWVMGESSAKKMRGGEMEDIIFSGTDFRPGRNVAEATLTLENTDRTGPAPYSEQEEIQVLRRIERGSGSNYRINGQEARARDVQLFFADIATGTKSSALVSQGQISDLIRAKPSGRKHLLEEAAGISGLQSRRHEAELRLKAAEANLERLGDVVSNLETQLAGLQRQARQAQRYRRLSDRIKEAESRWLLRRWRDAGIAVTSAAEALAEVEGLLGEATRQVAESTTAQLAAAEALPPLREAENAATSALNDLQVTRVALEAEERRLNEQRREIEGRLAQLGRDHERESTLALDARRALEAMAAEEAELAAQREGETEAIAAAEAACSQSREAVAALEAEVTRVAEERAQRRARRQSLESRIGDLEGRIARLDRQTREIEAERGQLNLGLDDSDSLDRMRRDEETAEAALEAAREAFAGAETRRTELREAEEAARKVFRDADSAAALLIAERDALAGLIARSRSEGTPLIDGVRVAAGYEAALGSALGDDLDVPLGGDGPLAWMQLPDYTDAPALPEGARPLSDHVRAPAELARRMAQIGVVEADQAEAMAARLRPGQRLVTTDGRLWRWDGFVMRDAETSAAARLAQRTRLEALGGEVAAAEGRREEQRALLETAAAAAAEAQRDDNTRRAEMNEAAEAAASTREARRVAESKQQAAEARRRDLVAMTERISGERGELAITLATARSELAEMPRPDHDDGLETLRDDLNGKRSTLSEHQGERDRLKREAEFRARRLEQIAKERQSWQSRAEGAGQRIADLEARRTTAAAEHADLERKPELIEAQKKSLADRLEAAEAARRAAGDTRQNAENLAQQRDRALRQAEAALSDLREERARRQGGVDQSRQAAEEVSRQIRERQETTPEALAESVPEPENLPEAADLEDRYGKVVRERENMGPVNLRAEIEATEVEEQLSVMLSEREDLQEAIARLRKGITELNREGRERLVQAFEEINGHFQSLYKRIFGGHAELLLVDSDDPLEAGLEIQASPSGKKMQILSLLSGGEQALTAMALIFALFLTNPAPVCVLDEVDAPLDDANVDRFCDLLDEFAGAGNTRFLIITHHRLTMARMDRLFGVTMSEPGVSQLVSVDLAAAEALRITA